MKLLLTVALLAFPVGAQKYAPLPTELTQAKTVYLWNLTGDPQPLDTIYRELRSWKRFEIVETKEKADLIFVIRFSESKDAGSVIVPIGSMVAAIPTRRTFTSLIIYKRETPEAPPVWSITRPYGIGINAPKDCIKELRKRFPK